MAELVLGTWVAARFAHVVQLVRQAIWRAYAVDVGLAWNTFLFCTFVTHEVERSRNAVGRASAMIVASIWNALFATVQVIRSRNTERCAYAIVIFTRWTARLFAVGFAYPPIRKCLLRSFFCCIKR